METPVDPIAMCWFPRIHLYRNVFATRSLAVGLHIIIFYSLMALGAFRHICPGYHWPRSSSFIVLARTAFRHICPGYHWPRSSSFIVLARTAHKTSFPTISSVVACISVGVDMCLDRLCGLVVRVSDYRSRGPGFDSRPYQTFWEIGGLEWEWGPLSLMRTIEELLEWKSSGSSLENRD
jgi:hypothetical protein